MLAQLFFVLNYNIKALSTLSISVDKIYLHWLCWLNFLDDWSAVFIQSAHRPLKYSVCRKKLWNFFKIYWIIFHFKCKICVRYWTCEIDDALNHFKKTVFVYYQCFSKMTLYFSYFQVRKIDTVTEKQIQYVMEIKMWCDIKCAFI